MWIPNREQWKSKESKHVPWLTTWRGVLELWDGTKKNWQTSLIHMGLHKTNTRWLVRSYNTFHARTNHKQFRHTRLTTTWTWGSHHLPPYSILCGCPWGPHPNDFLSQDSQVGVPKLPKLGLSWLWGAITLRTNLRWRWGLKQRCSPCQELSNGISHAICT